jgi:outer membrane immunogenic protein
MDDADFLVPMHMVSSGRIRGEIMESKSALLTSTALTTSMALISGAAVAADMPVKAPAFAPPFSWSGCYIGGNVGGAWADVDQSVNVREIVVIQSSGRSSSAIAGVQAGCNWQSTPNWVFGVEGDFNWLNLKRSHDFTSTSGEDSVGSQTTKLRWLTTVRARLGYAWDRSLFYVTGGLAGGGVKSSASAAFVGGNSIFSVSTSDTRWGWTVGAGYEYAFTRTISGKLEYLHFDLGSINTASGPADQFTWATNAKVSGDLVRVGINVKLNQ